MLASMTIPAVVLLAPNYQIIWQLGWMDTYKALVVPAAVSAFGIFLFRQAMLGVPNELIEAARIDGWGEFRIYLMLAMPLVRPMSGAFCLICFPGRLEFVPAPQYLSPKSEPSSLARGLEPICRPIPPRTMAYFCAAPCWP